MDDPQSNMLKIISIALFLIFAIAVLFFVRHRKKRRDRISNIIPLLEDDD